MILEKGRDLPAGHLLPDFRQKEADMSKLELHRCILGPIGTNCYLAINQETREALIVDPADQASVVEDQLRRYQAKPAAILLTHGHFDHIMAVPELKAKYQIPVYASEEEEEALKEPEINMTVQFGRRVSIQPDRLLKDLDVFTEAGMEIQMLLTPGHTKGSCCYYLKDEGVLFSGDTLFNGSVGRTDFPGGSTAEIVKSLHRLIDSLPEETEVYPGHDSETTIGFEKRYNPFV